MEWLWLLPHLEAAAAPAAAAKTTSYSSATQPQVNSRYHKFILLRMLKEWHRPEIKAFIKFHSKVYECGIARERKKYSILEQKYTEYRDECNFNCCRSLQSPPSPSELLAAYALEITCTGWFAKCNSCIVRCDARVHRHDPALVVATKINNCTCYFEWVHVSNVCTEMRIICSRTPKTPYSHRGAHQFWFQVISTSIDILDIRLLACIFEITAVAVGAAAGAMGWHMVLCCFISNQMKLKYWYVVTHWWHAFAYCLPPMHHYSIIRIIYVHLGISNWSDTFEHPLHREFICDILLLINKRFECIAQWYWSGIDTAIGSWSNVILLRCMADNIVIIFMNLLKHNSNMVLLLLGDFCFCTIWKCSLV